MGHHFVPQRYLRNFEDPDHRGYVWVHDRHGGEGQLANIAKVAQSRNFYSQSTEIILAETVEQPANLVIQKLTTRQPVTDGERLQLAYYIAVMMKRIPAHRRRSSEMLPEVLAGLVNEVRSYLNALADQAGADPEILKRRGLELEAVERKFQAHPPPNVLEQIREPWPSKQMVQLLFRMTWRVLISSGPSYFLTSDNPAFYFRSLGLGRKESELSFPLSTHYLLHGSWQRADSDLIFLNAGQAMVKEINRRIVSEAERLVFYHQAADWLPQMLKTENLLLNKIEWQKGYFAC
jgi:Protein of unknown function (DUF4238)